MTGSRLKGDGRAGWYDYSVGEGCGLSRAISKEYAACAYALRDRSATAELAVDWAGIILNEKRLRKCVGTLVGEWTG